MCSRGVARLAKCLIAAIALSAIVAAPAAASTAPTAVPTPTAPAGGIGLRLLEAPVTGREDPRAQIYIVDHLDRGAVIHREIELSNSTTSTARVSMYAAAATIADGAFLGGAGHSANDLSTWTSVSPGASDVIAGGRATATVTIAVPSDAAPGEQYGVVWAEVSSAPVVGGGVVQVSRVGIRLYVSVGPGAPPAAEFTIDSLTARRSPDGSPSVLATVRNTGGRALDLSGTLQLLDGPGGLSAGPFPAALGVTLAIGATAPVTIALDKQLPAGPWGAHIALRSGLVERSAQATITFPDAGTSAATGTSPSVSTAFPRPQRLYLTIAVLGVLVLAAFLAARTSAKRRTLHVPN